MLYPVGFTAADFGKPIVGIAHGHSTMNPCNAGIGSLVDRTVAAVKAAGGMPQTWGFPTGSDGISMGTEGMRYSLPSREEIARCIQIGWGSHQMDGLIAIGGRHTHVRLAHRPMSCADPPPAHADRPPLHPRKRNRTPLTIPPASEPGCPPCAGGISGDDSDRIPHQPDHPPPEPHPLR